MPSDERNSQIKNVFTWGSIDEHGYPALTYCFLEEVEFESCERKYAPIIRQNDKELHSRFLAVSEGNPRCELRTSPLDDGSGVAKPCLVFFGNSPCDEGVDIPQSREMILLTSFGDSLPSPQGPRRTLANVIPPKFKCIMANIIVAALLGGGVYLYDGFKWTTMLGLKMTPALSTSFAVSLLWTFLGLVLFMMFKHFSKRHFFPRFFRGADGRHETTGQPKNRFGSVIGPVLPPAISPLSLPDQEVNLYQDVDPIEMPALIARREMSNTSSFSAFSFQTSNHSPNSSPSASPPASPRGVDSDRNEEPGELQQLHDDDSEKESTYEGDTLLHTAAAVTPS